MPTLDTPLRLSNVFKPKIWGRKSLAPLFAPPEGSHELIGEVWITDDASRFLNGPVAGRTLADVAKEYGPELHGTNWQSERFPILAKYIFTRDWLSVQVHPDDDYARLHDPGNVGKTEMWYIVRADRKAAILLGVKPGVTREKLRAAFERGTSKGLLNSFRPKPGEAIFVPPGTIHALGPGLVLFEVEQNCDLTYRLDDFGRVGLDGKPRPLHLDKGMDVLRPELPLYRNLPRLVAREPFGTRRYVLASRHFALEEFLVRRAAHFQGSPRRVEVLSILDGFGRLENATGWFGFGSGDTWLIPPAAGAYRLVPRQPARLLKFYLPDLDEDFRQPLDQRRFRTKQIRKVIFD